MFEDGPGKIRNVTWTEAVQGIHCAAHLVASRLPLEVMRAALEGCPLIIATLALTGLYTALFESPAVQFSRH